MSNNNKKIAIIISIIALVALAFLFKNNMESSNSDKTVDTNKKVKEEIYFVARELETDENVGKEEMLIMNKNAVVIWQTKCGPCEPELKAIEKLRSKYKNINFIGIGLGDNNDDVTNKLKRLDINFKNYFLTEKFLNKNKSIDSTPTLLFVDKNGKELMYRLKGNTALNNDAEQVIKDIEKELDKFDQLKM
ncbi:TlpA family protein disulfide reductase [Peptostreptococcus equinus]|uniref:TlpA disulfide reductase family protein n=1 Tax=Peptostreptococcus equinus TaxID=3003601 RepID=A0ABY7JQP0_9FIRM|nr:TlpA disulfide reductase family protein [Peptostreptococcus sp. CBA3647]WAW15671.1 TlpA disulfide reductase family protein [Peptostreptococcus sp. CBA3647]